MRLDTSRFGAIDVAEDAVITFTNPIIGFQDYRRFVLLPGPDGSAVKWLQSIDSGDLAFIVMDPKTVFRDYAVELAEHELSELAVSTADELDIYTLVVVPADKRNVRTNLKAPILVNPRQRLAKQTVLERSNYPVQFPLLQAQQGTEGPREATHARTHP